MATSSSPGFLRWFGNLRCSGIWALSNFRVSLCSGVSEWTVRFLHFLLMLQLQKPPPMRGDSLFLCSVVHEGLIVLEIWRSLRNFLERSGMWQFLEVELLGFEVGKISKLGFCVSRAREWIYVQIDILELRDLPCSIMRQLINLDASKPSLEECLRSARLRRSKVFASGMFIYLITIWILRHCLGMSIREADSVCGEENLCKLTGCLGLERTLLIGVFLWQQRASRGC